MNQGRYKAKISKLERTLNYFLLINVILMLTMAISLSIACYYFNLKHYSTYLYIFQLPSHDEFGLAWRAFFSFYLILNSYIPLDLIVTLEIAKFIYTSIMQADAEMKQVRCVRFDGKEAEYEIKGFEAHTLNLHEDMAQVEYIFSDKTGTLTQNELIFRSLSIVSSD
jgi:magnesium-transporting ATPase (P-type)